MKRLLARLKERIDLPIEINEIRDALIDIGVQDKIIISDEALDTAVLRGTYYQWREHGALYGEPIWTSLIVYPRGIDAKWQRAICAKELVHIFDKQIVKTQTPEMVEKLSEELMQRIALVADSPANLMTTVDRLAAYMGLNFLFPEGARKIARDRLKTGANSIAQIADWAMIPEEYARLVLDEAWEQISELLLRLSNGADG